MCHWPMILLNAYYRRFSGITYIAVTKHVFEIRDFLKVAKFLINENI